MYLVPQKSTKDPRITQKGRFSAWLIKARSDGANAKWFQSVGRRYFTLDFDKRLFYYTHTESRQAQASTPIKFADILGAHLGHNFDPDPDCGQHGFSRPFRRHLPGTFPFTVRTKGKRLRLEAEEEPDAFQWISLLNAAHRIGAEVDLLQSLPAKRSEPARSRHGWSVSDPGHPSCSTPGIAYGEHPAAAAPNGAFLASAFACQTSCATNPMCKKFTWKRDGTDACWLIFDADATATSDPTAISGPPICEAKVEKSLEVQLKAAAKVHKKQTDEVFIGAKKGATLVASPGSSSDNSWLYSAAGIIGLGNSWLPSTPAKEEKVPSAVSTPSRDVSTVVSESSTPSIDSRSLDLERAIAGTETSEKHEAEEMDETIHCATESTGIEASFRRMVPPLRPSFRAAMRVMRRTVAVKTPASWVATARRKAWLVQPEPRLIFSCSDLQELFRDCAEELLWKLPDATSQELALVASAYSKLRAYDATLFRHVAAYSMRQAEERPPRATARCFIRAQRLLGGLADLSTISVVHGAVAASKAAHHAVARQLLEALTRRFVMLLRREQVTAHQVAVMARAFLEAGLRKFRLRSTVRPRLVPEDSETAVAAAQGDRSQLQQLSAAAEALVALQLNQETEFKLKETWRHGPAGQR
eukprot:g23116.t1